MMKAVAPVHFPRLILGGAGYAGLYRAVDEHTAHGALAAAWHAGIRAFDTAPHYGAGLSEERLGAFLCNHPRDDFVVSTKVGRLLYDDPAALDGTDGFFGTPARSRHRDYSASGVRRSLDESLKRLELQHVDVVLVHDPDDHQNEALAGAVPELARMRAEGTIAAVGVGVNDTDVALRFVREAHLDCVLIAGRYSLLDRRADSLLEECAARGISVLVGGVFNSGILADPNAMRTFDYRQATPQLADRVKHMQRLCEEYGVTLRAAALQFPLRHPAVASVLSGAANAHQVEDTVTQMAVTVPDDLWAELEEFVWQR